MARNSSDGTYTRNFKDGTKVHFNAQGLQTSVVDRNLNTATFTYDGSARLLSVTDPAGLVTTLTYSAGRLQTITDPAGRQTLFLHDSAGNLLRITDPDASSVSYLYDGKGHITQGTDVLGQSTTYAYDFAGRFTQSTRPSGETRSLVATKVRGLVDTAAGQGSPTNPAPVVTSANATAALTDGRGNQSRFALDALGQATSQSDALGQTTATVRDANGLPTRIIRPNGAVTTMAYDTKGNLLTTTDPVGATTIFTYEPVFNQVKTIRDPKGNTTTINYDVKGNPIEIIDALNNSTQMSYDTRGLLLLATSAVGTAVQTTTRFAYDGNGNLITTTNPKGDVTTLAYNIAGNVSTSTDAENRVTQFTYDVRNRLITVLDADLKTTQYGYDPKGNLIQVRDAKNQLTTFVYDAMDRLASATNPLGFTERFTYDSNGNLTSTTNRNGQIVAFAYDALNRLISKTRPPTLTETIPHVANFAYDPVSNLLSVITPTTGVFNTYDAASRLASSSSTLESSFSTAVLPINVDTTIGATNFQFEGQTLQVNGRTLTVNGEHTFANVILLNGAILTHSPTTETALGKLDIVVTGTIQIDSTSRIDVSGRGFLGGGQAGNPSATNGMTVGFQSTNQSGTAGSYGGLGGGGVATSVYGDFRNPNEVGSGGGGFQGAPAGNGGGLVRIIAQSIVLDGSIRANGGPATNFSAGGSGGGIRLDTGSVSGIGSMSANGSPASPLAGGGGGGGGRIAVYYQSASTFNPTNVSAFGATFTGSSINGGAGTVYLQGPARESGELVVDNNNLVTPVASTTPISVSPGATLTLTHLKVNRAARAKLDHALILSGTLEVANAGEFVVADKVTANSINLVGGGILTHPSTTGNTVFKLDINVQDLTIDAASRIDVSGRGFLGGGRPGNPSEILGMTLGFVPLNGSGTAGSHGGLGGTLTGVANATYGDFRNPNNVGSGGGSFPGGAAGSGGGLTRIVAQTISLHGSIRANGGSADSTGAGGGGGGIRVDVGTLQGSGTITANGSAGFLPAGGGGGGGGRIAVYYQNGANYTFDNVTTFGAAGGGAPNGGAGTVYLQGPARDSGELVIDNNNLTVLAVSRTPIQGVPSTTLSLSHLRIRRNARAKFDGMLNLTGTLEISNNGEFASGTRVISNSTNLTSNSALTHTPTTGTAAFKLDLATETLTIDGTSRIDVIGLGFLGGGRPGNPSSTNGTTLGFKTVNGSGTAGSHGGFGGAFSGSTNPLYGVATNPNDVGSGGGGFNGSAAGNGGGLARIAAQTFVLNGAVRAGGGLAEGFSAGGSGGGIRIDVGTLTGIGVIGANGSSGTPSGGGGGGGGRIAVYYESATGFNLSNITANGGIGSGAPNGQSGTIHLQQQIAQLSPTFGDAMPVITARGSLRGVRRPVTPAVSGPEQANPPVIAAMQNHIANTDLQQRKMFVSNVVEVTKPAVDRQNTNLYLAMIAAEKLQPFVTTGVTIADSGVSEISALTPQSEIQNPKLDDLDPIYTYDLNGNRTSMIDPTGLTSYAYDALNRLISITNNKGQVTSFTYDALGRRTAMTHANGAVTNYSYDVASQLLNLTHQRGGVTINTFAYAYDKVGNRKSKADTVGTANYTYDVLNRLTQAVNPQPTNPLETFSYDPVGNRASSNQNGASIFNAANQLLEDTNFTNHYDKNGNLIRKTAKLGGAITDYEYDAENKLVRVVSPSNTANYSYDGLGRRVGKEVISGITTTTKYVYDNEDILLELNGANQIVARYTHGPGIDEPLIMEKDTQSFYYHADALGSITELTNQSGTVAQRYAYSSFGKIESRLDSNLMQPYEYTARELDDETGLNYYRARSYDSHTGRFVQQDGDRYPGDPGSLYAYVLNNPVNSVDPSGNIVQFLTPDTYLDLGSLAYDVYRIVVDNLLNDCDNLGANLASLGGNLVGLAVPGLTGVGTGIRGAGKSTLVIGKLKDLNPTALRSGEDALNWVKKGTPQLNWQENSRQLREAVAQGRSIRDASIDAGKLIDNTGFLRAERNLLENLGWKFNGQTGYWHP